MRILVSSLLPRFLQSLLLSKLVFRSNLLITFLYGLGYRRYLFIVIKIALRQPKQLFSRIFVSRFSIC